jgi:hypothetical protein
MVLYNGGSLYIDDGRPVSGPRIRPGLQAAGWPCCAINAKIACR